MGSHIIKDEKQVKFNPVQHGNQEDCGTIQDHKWNTGVLTVNKNQNQLEHGYGVIERGVLCWLINSYIRENPFSPSPS